jgi:MFS family permease
MGLIFFRLSRLVPPPERETLSRAEIGTLLRVLLQPGILGMLLVLALHNMSIIAFMSMMPLYLETVRDFSPGLTSVAFSTFVVTGTVMAPVVGRISDRAGRKRIALFGLFGGGICAWLVTIAPGNVGLFAALMVTGMLMLSVRVVVMAMALELVGGREATVIGFLFTLGEAPAALSTALAGLVGEVDLSLSLVLAAGLSLASGTAAAIHSFKPTEARTKAAS